MSFSECACFWYFLDQFYDWTAALISISDFVTDVIVVADFYEAGKMSFFYAGLGMHTFCKLNFRTQFFFSYFHHLEHGLYFSNAFFPYQWFTVFRKK
jgi:hypothetical protein